MAPVPLTAGVLADLLPTGAFGMISGCAAESGALADLLLEAGESLRDVTLSGVFVPGLNRTGWIESRYLRALTFFQTPPLRAHAGRTEFLPLCYQDIAAELRRRRPSAAFATLSPPDADGWCSFGPELGFIPDLWNEIPIRIAHINPSLPRSAGHRGVRFETLSAWIEADAPLLSPPDDPADAVAEAIGRHAAAFIEDGTTIQTGLGKLMTAVLGALRDRHRLRLHTGLVGDGVLALIESGALDCPGSVLAGAAIGSPVLYARLGDPLFDFQPVSVTHDPRAIARADRFVAINAALEVDLFGQVHAELTPKGFMSGPGGASDFARGARLGNGLRIVVLPSDAKDGAISRIVAAGVGAGPVSLSRTDVDVVVTEHGAADLRGKGHETRAEALVGIASPAHRETLRQGWREHAARF